MLEDLGPTELIGSVTLFVLAIFLGFELITKVPAMLHTPLMSGANAISGISVVGALLGANVALMEEKRKYPEYLHLLRSFWR